MAAAMVSASLRAGTIAVTFGHVVWRRVRGKVVVEGAEMPEIASGEQKVEPDCGGKNRERRD